ncbi:MAG: hypothetical protein PVJ73_08240, partial [Acidobacteriota bacterium]
RRLIHASQTHEEPRPAGTGEGSPPRGRLFLVADELLHRLPWVARIIHDAARGVDENAGVIRIEDTKTDEPWTLPYGAPPQLAAFVKQRRQLTDLEGVGGGARSRTGE